MVAAVPMTNVRFSPTAVSINQEGGRIELVMLPLAAKRNKPVNIVAAPLLQPAVEIDPALKQNAYTLILRPATAGTTIPVAVRVKGRLFMVRNMPVKATEIGWSRI